jgi:hypothetical protein
MPIVPRRVSNSLIGATIVSTKLPCAICALRSDGGSGAIRAAIMPGAMQAAMQR